MKPPMIAAVAALFSAWTLPTAAQSKDGASPPSMTALAKADVPMVPGRFCSQEHKDQTLAKLVEGYVYWDGRADDSVNTINSIKMQMGMNCDLPRGADTRDPKTLETWYERARQEDEYSSGMLDRYSRARDAGKAMPVSDCGDAVPAGYTFDPENPKPPARFCSQEEKDRFLGEATAGYVYWDGRSSDAANARGALERDVEAACGRPPMPILREWLAAAETEAAETSAALERYSAARKTAEATPVSDCDAAQADDVILSFGLFGGQIRLPRLAFFGREPVGATMPTLGLFPAERTIEADLLQAEADIYRIFGTGLNMALSVTRTQGDSFTTFGRTDLQGERFLVPGLGVGANPNGFSFGYANGLNSPQDVALERSFEEFAVEDWIYWKFDLGYEREVIKDISVGLDIVYSHGEDTASARASIPGYAREVSYMQEIETDVTGAGVRAAATLRIDDGIDLCIDGFGRPVYVEAEGTNRLNLTGFPEQRVAERVSGTGFEYGMTASLEVAIAEDAVFAITAGFFESNDTSPVFVTPGGGARSRIELEDRSGWSVGGVLSVSFGD